MSKALALAVVRTVKSSVCKAAICAVVKDTTLKLLKVATWVVVNATIRSVCKLAIWPADKTRRLAEFKTTRSPVSMTESCAVRMAVILKVLRPVN